ncbi:gas vesicle protein GvpH [Natrialbaceae archaeon AArc-T1-2]|uniref:gas vesicle protein GvpH n=1 Tax=Natrialbaceae archaeon AArc-T1-2 TaxID=3053904 RepID=UPI00255AF97B|nr:gas vesicle protein GvpH [Natrialbaceae archaeon AArc-T1-2]WIV67589.1 gas vesicle protein GvpH [Natrialbaceae archaeon AArc-T1-2]
MSDDPPDRPTDGPADDQPEEPSTIGGWLSNLLAALEGIEEGSRSDRRRSGRTALDYSVAVRSGLDDLEESENRPSRDDFERRRPDSDRPGTRRKRTTASQYHVTTRTREDELLVTADLGEIDPDDVVVGYDDTELVVGVEDRALERVHVPWTASTAEATFHNGILTVTVEPEAGRHE